MSNEKFKVIFTGKLGNSVEIEKVANMFALKFNISPEKAIKILKANKEMVLNKSVEHIKAYKLKSALEEIGMQTRLERVLMKTTKRTEQSKESQDAVNEEIDVDNAINESNVRDWAMEEITKNTDETVTKPTQIIQDNPTSNSKVSYSNEPESGFFKRFGGTIAAIGAGLVIFLKKFGLFKLLKLGLIFGAASAVIGFDGDEACMGNSLCEKAVDKQMDACWENSGFDDIDWDELSDSEFLAMKPRIETDFIGCFKYQDTGERIFVSPIDIRFDLMSFCESSNLKNCNEIIEPQIKSCYDKHDLGNLFSEDTTDYYAVFEQYPEKITQFYSCIVDENGSPVLMMDYQ
jgi:hypothetical protein